MILQKGEMLVNLIQSFSNKTIFLSLLKKCLTFQRPFKNYFGNARAFSPGAFTRGLNLLKKTFNLSEGLNNHFRNAREEEKLPGAFTIVLKMF